MYIEYLDYVRNIKFDETNENFNMLKIIKTTVEKVHKFFINLFNKLIEQDNPILNDYELNELNDFLQLPAYFNYNTTSNLILIKKINFLFHQILNTKNLTKSKLESIIRLFNENELNTDEAYISFIREFIRKVIITQETLKKDQIFLLLNILLKKEIEDEEVSQMLTEIITDLNQNYLTEIHKLYEQNKINVNRYLVGCKDIRKLLEKSQEESAYSEIVIIVNNNLIRIVNFIIRENPLLVNYAELSKIPISNKKAILNKFEEHANFILETVENYFFDNLFMLKSETFETEVNQFKSDLLSSISESLSCLYNSLGLKTLWEMKVKGEKQISWTNYLIC